MKIIVSDTTSLIVLEGLQSLSLLCEVFEQVLVPEVVLQELRAGSADIAEVLTGINCIEIVTVPASALLSDLQMVLDTGESAAIALAIDRQLPLLIDERKGRSIAQRHQLVVTGFAGLLILAVRMEVLPSDQALNLLDRAVKNGFRLSEGLYKQVRETLRNYLLTRKSPLDVKGVDLGLPASEITSSVNESRERN